MADVSEAKEAKQEKISEDSFLQLKTKYLCVTCREKMNCSFDEWYPTFKKHTIRSRIIALPKDFIDYLREDGLKLPPQLNSEMDDYYALDSDNDESDIETKNENESSPPQFVTLIESITKAMTQLGGIIVPKLNWSAPKDAIWINSQSLQCETITQLLLLLKSSQFLQCDLNYPFCNCIDYESNSQLSNGDSDSDSNVSFILVLRKYSPNLYENREMRVFIYDNSIIAICQRSENYFKDLQCANLRQSLQSAIVDFFNTHICNRFPNQNYTMDVYIDKQMRVYVMDFNPFYEITDALLFSWVELCQMCDAICNDDKAELEFRVECDAKKSLGFSSQSQYRYPIDAVDLSNADKIAEFIESAASQQ